MSKVVLDASAILAAIGDEPGADVVFANMSDSAVSTVNLAEVQSKLIERGFPAGDAWDAAMSFAREVVVFDSRHARAAGALISSTRALGLSFGDRACLALAMILEAPLYTTDRIWARLDLGLNIHLLR